MPLSSYRRSAPEGRRLMRPVPVWFEQFYRAELRYCCGARLRTMEVRRRFDAWAVSNNAPQIGQPELVRHMDAVGHSYFKSSGSWFGNVAFATDRLDIDDNFPAPAIGGDDLSDADRSPKLAALAMIDRAMAGLHAARVRIEGI